MYPILLDLYSLKIYSYPLLMGLAWGIGVQLCFYYLDLYKIDRRSVYPLGIGVFLTSWIGAKVFFLIYSTGNLFEKYAESSAFWLGGGFVFYGGLLFCTLFCLFYTLILKKFPFKNLFLFLPSLAIGHGIGRLGCFLAGCCYGNHCDLPWAVNLHSDTRHPVQIYESILVLFLGIFLHKKVMKKSEGKEVISFYFMAYALIRFFMEFFRGDKIRGVHSFGLSTSQYISLVIFLGLAVYLRYCRQKKGGEFSPPKK